MLLHNYIYTPLSPAVYFMDIVVVEILAILVVLVHDCDLCLYFYNFSDKTYYSYVCMGGVIRRIVQCVFPLPQEVGVRHGSASETPGTLYAH